MAKKTREIAYSFEEALKESLEYFDNDAMSAEVFLNKYALKDQNGRLKELTPDTMHRRLAKEFARIERKFGGKEVLSEEKIYNLFKNFKYVVPQGSPMTAIGNPNFLMSASNCTVIEPPEDDMGSIMDAGNEMAQLMKRRCGVGIDISNLRPCNAPVRNAALSSSGAYSFADYYSYITRMIGQKGRQGALMVTMDIRHPDSALFATMKQDSSKVTGANVSLKITDDFMEAVRYNRKFTLRWPLEGEPKITRDVKARELFDTIVSSAYSTGDPGLLMWDNVTKNLPAHCYEEFPTVSTNPCSEIPLSPNDCCRLISINLASFVNKPYTDEACFDMLKFQDVVRNAMRLSDDLVEIELELMIELISRSTNKLEKHLWKKMAKAADLGRRTGLGAHGLGDVLAKMGVRYDSKRAHEIADSIYENLRNFAYMESILLAKERGAFPLFDWNKEKDCEFFKRMPSGIIKDMAQHGRRNIALLTNAPTGTVAMMSKTTSGIEPIFRLKYMRRVKVHGNDKIKVDFTDETGEKWHHYNVIHHSFKEFCDLNGLDPMTTEIPNFFTPSDQLDYKKNVKMIGIIQSYIDHGVSCTINMPKESTSNMVRDVYLDGWKSGMKGITVYVEGSKAGVLVDEEGNRIEYSRAPKRPRDIPCEIHITKCLGKRWLVIVGLLGGEPYEVFAGRASDLPMPRDVTEAVIRKVGKRQYSIVYEEEGEEIFVPIKESFLEEQGMLIRLLMNQSMRHGVPLEVLYDTVTKASDMNDFSRTVVRILKKYIKEDSKDPFCPKCDNCQSKNMKPIDGCYTCMDCNHSKCM